MVQAYNGGGSGTYQYGSYGGFAHTPTLGNSVKTWAYNAVNRALGNKAEDYPATYGQPAVPKTNPEPGPGIEWGNPSKSAVDNSQMIGAIDRRQGGGTVSNDGGWSNTPAPGGPTGSDTSGFGGSSGSSRGSVGVGGGFVPGPAPSRGFSRTWEPIERPRTQPRPAQPGAIGRPIIDIAPAPAPQPSTTAPTKVGGPSGFMEQFDAPTAAMPSVDQLYKTYTDMAGENQGMREYIASPQFQGLWQSANVPYWMLSDPVWRSYLQKIGLLNWDALARRMGRQ